MTRANELVSVIYNRAWGPLKYVYQSQASAASKEYRNRNNQGSKIYTQPKVSSKESTVKDNDLDLELRRGYYGQNNATTR